MYYEFNISLNGNHLFATAKRSATNENAAVKIGQILQVKFPAKEGYEVTISYYPEVGFEGEPIHAKTNIAKAIDELYKEGK